MTMALVEQQPQILQWVIEQSEVDNARSVKPVAEGLEIGMFSVNGTPILAIFYSGYGNYPAMRRDALTVMFEKNYLYSDILVSSQTGADLIFSTILGNKPSHLSVKDKQDRLVMLYRTIVK